MTPVLSVLTPSYNYERFLGDCLDSVRGQGGPVEHIVVDDGSTDDSVALLRQRESEIVFKQQTNAGLSSTLNHALSLAKGDWVGWLNADDFYLPDIVKTITSRDDADVIHGDFVFVEKTSRMTRLAPQHRYSRIVLRGYGPFTSPPAMFVRRRLLDGFSFDETAIKLMDWDLYLDLARRGARFIYVPKVIGAFRRHEDQQSNKVTPESERRLIRSRYGLTINPALAKGTYGCGAAVHALLKAVNGGYRRQAIADRSFGVDLRWWLDGDAEARVRRFLRQLDG